ncbi:hypothetical protein KAM448_43270 [Aeromonas caviae]|uniref:Uncharacterized protein n=1 Tax=Aeromonas caviae TaxID=648 RepID=A0ABD0BDL3_AERCA|nr:MULTISPECIES: hypothetical protein [Aeromonas]BCR30364.1 hypothetical protein KAM376_33700 [Aeromonas caviae]GJA83781.1 hypothetical protein KAM355_43410 [Aeromonas caviae]GJB00598.1 hypothetical protein KAM359_40050 [Aeromonas caviae]GJB13832.1 hypothetical protein KAM362_43920 [Aeromonas caviae]GJB26600.1 hypothetical protein KAM365_43500 [Aeromonas caviae]
MNKKEKINKYATQLISELNPRLGSDIQVNIVIYTPKSNGGVVEVKLDRTNKKEIKKIKFDQSYSNVNNILNKIPQKFISGDLGNIKFSGTNISLEDNRILVIKGDDEHWSESDAKKDINSVFHAKVK